MRRVPRSFFAPTHPRANSDLGIALVIFVRSAQAGYRSPERIDVLGIADVERIITAEHDMIHAHRLMTKRLLSVLKVQVS